MRLWIFSDLHLNPGKTYLRPQPGNDPDHDIVVVAGDVSEGCTFAAAMIGLYAPDRSKPTIFVPGNHDFYHQVLQDDLIAARPVLGVENVHLLSRDTVVIGGVRFVGATLWTDYRLIGTPKPSMIEAGQTLNDHRLIQYREASGHIARFMPWHAAAEHRLDLAFLNADLSKPFAGPTVVVTHHLPSARSIATRFQGSSLNPAFASDLDWLIEKHQPELWVHGHTHDPCDYRIGKTRVLCNPKGYGQLPESQAYRPRLIVEVGEPWNDGQPDRAVDAPADGLPRRGGHPNFRSDPADEDDAP